MWCFMPTAGSYVHDRLPKLVHACDRLHAVSTCGFTLFYNDIVATYMYAYIFRAANIQLQKAATWTLQILQTYNVTML